MLNNLSILNTRPDPHNKILTEKLLSLGAQVISCPALKLCPLAFKYWNIDLKDLSKFHTILLTSPYSAEIFFNEMSKQNINFYSNKQLIFIAIGHTTKQIIINYVPYANVLLPKIANSEHICNLEYLKILDPLDIKNILYPICLDGGRQFIAPFLIKAGHKVVTIFIYKKQEIPINFKLTGSAKPNVILITCETTLKNFIKQQKLIQHQLAQNYQVICYSKRLEKIAKSYNIPSTSYRKPDKIIDKLKIISNTLHKKL